MDVIARLLDCQWSVQEIAARAGLPVRLLDAVLVRYMPGDEAQVPAPVVQALESVLPRARRRPGAPDGPQPLVGTRGQLPLVVVGSQPAVLIACLARHDSVTAAELAAALPPTVSRKRRVVALLSRMLHETDLLTRDPGNPPYRYRLSPLGWRVADALARWRP